jgi:hypothetical protein
MPAVPPDAAAPPPLPPLAPPVPPVPESSLSLLHAAAPAAIKKANIMLVDFFIVRSPR